MKIKGRIYRIITDAPDGRFMVYVGATTQDLGSRLAQHRSKYEAYKSGKHNKDVGSFAIVSKDYHAIHLEEEIEFEDLNELLKAERRAYDKYSTHEDYIITNKNVPARTAAEYYASPATQERIRRYHASEKGKEAIRKANKKYYEANKEKKRAAMRDKYYERKAKNAPQNEQQPPNNGGEPQN